MKMAKKTTSISIQENILNDVRRKIAGKISFSTYMRDLIIKDLGQNIEIQEPIKETEHKQLQKELKDNTIASKRKVQYIRHLRNTLNSDVVRANEISDSKLEEIHDWLKDSLIEAESYKYSEEDINEIKQYIELIQNNDITTLINIIMDKRKLDTYFNNVCKQYGVLTLLHKLNKKLNKLNEYGNITGTRQD